MPEMEGTPPKLIGRNWGGMRFFSNFLKFPLYPHYKSG
jgi:hypothetical protein